MTQPNRQTHPTPGAALRAYLDTLPPPTLEQIAAMRAKGGRGWGYGRRVPSAGWVRASSTDSP